MAIHCTSIDAYLCSLLMSTGKARIRSMTQLRHFPLLHRDLTEAVRQYVRATLSQPVYATALKQAGMKTGHAEMQALQRLLHRSLNGRDADPVYVMDRVLAMAGKAGTQSAMTLLERFTHSLCNDACRQLHRAG